MGKGSQRLRLLSWWAFPSLTIVSDDAFDELTSATVLPEGPDAIVGKELGGAYFDKAGPVVELQVARAGYRMAAWLEMITEEYMTRRKDSTRHHQQPAQLEL